MTWQRSLAVTAALACALTAGGVAPAPAHAADPVDCAAPATAIGAVQGSGGTSPVVGTRTTIQGVVVGDFQVGGFDGYYLQDDGDGDDATSDGIFVYHPGGADVVPGDVVRVAGEVSEFDGLTEVTADVATSCGAGELPAAVELQLPAAAETYESLEGMRVRLPQSLPIIEYYNYARYGEIVVATDRQYQPTAVHAPGSAEAAALAAANAANRITLDDGRSWQNPDPAVHPNGAEFTLDNRFRGGDLVTGATGVLDHRHDLWRVQLTSGAEVTGANPRPGVPEVGGNLQVGSFNVLNYFTTVGERGADTAEEFERQQAKIVAAINELDAQIVGLLEIENNDGEALDALVGALNEAADSRKWAAVRTGTVGSDAITTALIYQPAKVAPVGRHAVLDESVDPRFDTGKNRPALAQTFLVRGAGSKITVAVSHLKSKGSSCEDIGDPEDPNGQGNCNGVRTAAAAALADWLTAGPTHANAPLTLIIGDLNSYDHEDPITTLVDAGFTDLVRKFQGEYAYSYVFDGQLGYLDHALANGALAARVTGTAEWHLNADEPSLIDYDMTFKADAQDALYAADPYRSSDHDAVVVGIDARRTAGQRGR